MSHQGPAHEHKATAPTRLRFSILTISDSRSLETDASGDVLQHHASQAGHETTRREVVKDEPDEIRSSVERFLLAHDVDVVLTTGGTGIAPRDVTLEAVGPLFDRALPGFGELFRMLSYQQIGSAAMLSRAGAGVAQGKPVFVLPGSPDACALAMTTLILPEAGHLVGLLRRA